MKRVERDGGSRKRATEDRKKKFGNFDFWILCVGQKNCPMVY